jgi:ABC-type transporter Mla MlaB component
MVLDDLHASTLVLSGPATLYESSEIRETLLTALTEGKDLRVDLETSGPWDLAGLQLLISSEISGRKSSLAVRLVHVPRGCAEVAERSGLTDWLKNVSESFL